MVPQDVPAGEVLAALREGAGELLEDVALFDVYAGKGIEEGKKSLAFSLRFRAERPHPDGRRGLGRARGRRRRWPHERFGAVQR